jgi:RNA polymerase sigma-70 factor (ECF subfamily)
VPSEIEQLYREHRAGLVRLVERELHDHHDAEDVVQTAFLDAQRALERGTTPRNPRAWLAAIALNAAHRLRRRRLSAAPLEEYAVQEASRMPEIRAALAGLPRSQRVAVVYRDVLGLSYGETAEQMGTSVNAVTMLLHRGRQRLRQTLGLTTDGVGLWRWLRQSGTSQLAIVKGTAAVVAAAGLTTAGVATARAVAPVGTVATTAPAARSGSPTTAKNPASGGGGAARESVRRRSLTTAGPTRPSGPPPAASLPSLTAATAGTSSAGAGASPADPAATSTSVLRVPSVSLPTLPLSSATAVAATVTVSTPVTAVTVTTPPSTTATATTPLTTVTVPVP